LASFLSPTNRRPIVLTPVMDWISWINDPAAWGSLVTLTFLEIVLGIDNLIFISILSSKLPLEQQGRARKVGLSLALVTRILLLCSLKWVMGLNASFHHWKPFGLDVPSSGKDIVLAVGGLFLIWKSVKEIHEKLEGEDGEQSSIVATGFSAIVIQIILLDIVFSLDSVITAVGMASQLPIMVTAVILAMIVMLMFVNQIGKFVERHPTIKMLALSFLILIGVMLLAEGFGHHVNKGYIYFAMAFAFLVEVLNIRIRKKSKVVEFHQPYR